MTMRLPRLRDERGIAVMVAIGTITVTAALAGVLVAAASTFLHTSSRDSYNKRALAAAQAGLNVGASRFARIAMAPSGSFETNCITNTEVAWSASVPHCPAATGYFNTTGATSSFYLTADLSSSGLSGMSTVATECGSSAAGDRCLTAVGTVNGVTRRLQERVRVLDLFTMHGMLGLKGTEINSSESWSGANFNVTSDTGSNGPITYGQNVSPPGSPYQCYLGPAGTAPGGCPQVKYGSNITVPSVDTLPFNTTQGTNSNATITVAQGYTAATRSLTVAAGKTLTLNSGDYNFCFVTLANGATLSAIAGSRVRIFVDSPARAGSGCTSPTGGKFNAASTSAKVNLGASQGQLEIYMYGTAAPPANLASPPPVGTCNTDFNLNSSAAGPSSNIYLYAPDSQVLLRSNAYQLGAIVGCKVTYWAESASARWDYPPTGIRPSAGAGAIIGSFRECSPTYTGDPESGCG